MPSSSHENDLIFATTQAGVPCCLLGSLVQIEEGTVFLEDAYAVIKLDFSRTQTFGGFFAEGMVVVAEGSMSPNSDVFIVDALGHPPFEPRDAAFRAIGGRHLDVIEKSISVFFGTIALIEIHHVMLLGL